MKESAPAPQVQEVQSVITPDQTPNPWSDLRDAQERVAAEERRLRGEAASWTSRVKVYAAGQDVLDKMQADPSYTPTADDVAALNNYDHQQQLDIREGKEAMTEDDIAYYRHQREQAQTSQETETEPVKALEAPAVAETPDAPEETEAPEDTPKTPEAPEAGESVEVDEELPELPDESSELANEPEMELVESETPAEPEEDKDPDVRLAELKQALKDGIEDIGSVQEFSQTEEAEQMLKEYAAILRGKNLSKEQYRLEMLKLTTELMGEAPKKQRFARVRKLGGYLSGLWRKGIENGRAFRGEDEGAEYGTEPAPASNGSVRPEANVYLDENNDVKGVELREVPADEVQESITDEEVAEAEQKESAYAPGDNVLVKYVDGRYFEAKVLGLDDNTGEIAVIYKENEDDPVRTVLVNAQELDRWQQEFADDHKEDEGNDSEKEPQTIDEV